MNQGHPRFRPEIKDWAVRVVLSERRADRRATIAHMAKQIGCTPTTLARWVRQVEKKRQADFSAAVARHMIDLEEEIESLREQNAALQLELEKLRNNDR